MPASTSSTRHHGDMTDATSHPKAEQSATPPPSLHLTHVYFYWWTWSLTLRDTLPLWGGDKWGKRSPAEVWRHQSVLAECVCYYQSVCHHQVCGGPEWRHGGSRRCEMNTCKPHMWLQDTGSAALDRKHQQKPKPFPIMHCVPVNPRIRIT